MRLFYPDTLEIESLIQKGPSYIHNFNKWKMLYFVHLLTTLSAVHKKSRSDGGYINLKSTYMQGVVHDYKQYLEFLIDNFVIECNNKYSTDKFSKSYRLSPNHFFSTFDTLEISDADFAKKVADKIGLSTEDKKRLNQYLHLMKQFEKLEFNYEGVLSYYSGIIFQSLLNARTINDGYWNDRFREIKVNNILLRDKDYTFKIDNVSGRFHNVLTRLRKEFRHFLHIGGQSLIGLDIKSSQPYISQVLLNKDFWVLSTSAARARRGSRSLISLSDVVGKLDTGVRAAVGEIVKRAPMLDRILKKDVNQSVTVYKNILNNGDIYEHVLEVSVKLIKAESKFRDLYELDPFPLNRNEMKGMVLRAMYAPIRSRSAKTRFIHGVFKYEFPVVYEIFSLIKGVSPKNYRVLALILQSVESEIILNKIAKKIIGRGGSIPFFTIHDSILTLPKFKDTVKDIMIAEFEISIGEKPTIKDEDYSLIELKNMPVPNLQKESNRDTLSTVLVDEIDISLQNSEEN